MFVRFLRYVTLALTLLVSCSVFADGDKAKTDFFERRIRPILVQHCYECHSEDAGEQQGGLLLDRESGWMQGGESNKAVIPFEPDSSLLIAAVRYSSDDLQMPPDGRLDDESIKLLESWVSMGAVGPAEDMGETEFSRLGDQVYLFDKANDHWAFKPIKPTPPPAGVLASKISGWNTSPIDQFVFAKLTEKRLTPSRDAPAHQLARRLYYDLTGLPPTRKQVLEFIEQADHQRESAVESLVDDLLDSPEFGQHIGRMWLDVARYADTDSAYRADTKTPHYFPFAFTYRDYVVDAFNADKPYDQFLKEQFAADLMGFARDSPEMAALGFLGVAPHANRAPLETLDDWIDVTTRGLMGMTVACARCHDHKFEPIPTVDYYSLRGVFDGLSRPHPLDEKKQPELAHYQPVESEQRDFAKRLAAINKKIADSGNKKARNNNRPISVKLRDTELAQLLLFHPGAPARAMVVLPKKTRAASFVHVRGDIRSRGENAPPRFLKILDQQQTTFSSNKNDRLELIEKIASSDNPLTARVFVNRVWGHLMGSHLVRTPSDFGLQGSAPTHPRLLDWLADDFIRNGWSTKRLVRQIVTSKTYCQSSSLDESKSSVDPENLLLWRANRKHLTIEALRDSVLAVTGFLDRTIGGHPAELWGDEYTRRRTIYGYINRFNLDPTLRAFDFPAPMQTQPLRGESIVAPQALFLMNSPFVIDQCNEVTRRDEFQQSNSDSERIEMLFDQILQRQPAENEIARVEKFLGSQRRLVELVKNKGRFSYDPWPMVAQSLIMSNEFQYVD